MKFMMLYLLFNGVVEFLSCYITKRLISSIFNTITLFKTQSLAWVEITKLKSDFKQIFHALIDILNPKNPSHLPNRSIQPISGST